MICTLWMYYKSGVTLSSLSVCVLDQMRQYITQLRQETGVRLVEKVYGSSDQPSKVCNILPCVWYIYTHTNTHIHYLLLPLAVVDMLH